MSARKDIKNRIFNDIYVLEFDREENTHARYKCLCMLCNKILYVNYINLKSGNTKSCQSCGQKISNGLAQDIQWQLVNGSRIVDISKMYNLSRSTIHRIKKQSLNED